MGLNSAFGRIVICSINLEGSGSLEWIYGASA